MTGEGRDSLAKIPWRNCLFPGEMNRRFNASIIRYEPEYDMIQTRVKQENAQTGATSRTATCVAACDTSYATLFVAWRFVLSAVDMSRSP
jgi:hypothetical protein